MPRHTDTDVVIAGGGIVGLATALALSQDERRSITVLEAEPHLAAHQTSHNSGVIHSGLYYKPGSLKAQLCTAGREAMYAFCREHDIAHERCGKLVVATHDEELPRLDQLHKRAAANGLEDVARLDGEELKQYEPNVSGIAGLRVPQTGIVDFAAVARAMAELAGDRGVEIRLSAPLHAADVDDQCLLARTPIGSLRTKFLVVCAGLQCDRVARRCGLTPDVRIVPFRGEYWRLSRHASRLVNNMIYPVPDPAFPFLGVHLTRGLDNVVEVGPNAILALDRHGYHKTDLSWRDTLDTLRFKGFRRLARQHWRTGVAELRRSFSRRVLLRDIHRLVPAVNARDLEPARSGIRAQAVRADGGLVDDFYLLDGPRMLHVLNAPSPAATASIAIGRHLAEQVERRLAESS